MAPSFTQLTAFTLLSFTLAMGSITPTQASDEERPIHYEAQQPNSPAEAIAILQERLTQVKAAESAGDLERVHELSYDMEAAVGKLERHVLKLKFKVEAIHDASENAETEKLKTALPKLEGLIGALAK